MGQLKSERKMRRNAETKEQHWKKKFGSEALEMDDEDQPDLINIFQNTDEDCVPPHMTCLWEQQKKILSTNNKNGYRWHPKYVYFVHCTFRRIILHVYVFC